ncbi:hypothetical protein RHGRI_035263 [Rhododendron griersonianum]|uniref:Uncharacterized protein n=1 Tax=Rhododendron griersonianum TaxID=479676 RepID=A0AAV6I4G5_9ERIC|nr:hypothetical protein RHGRI_035263 [Rhododendron griersonianum]
MADGTISFVDGLGIKGIDSHEIRRKNRASAFTPQNLTPNQACGSKWVYPQPFSVRVAADARVSGRETKVLPPCRSRIGAGGDRRLAGCNPFLWQVCNSVFIYNFLSATWRCGTDMPGGRRLFSGYDSNFVQMVYVAGGHDEDKNALKSALAYDVVKDEWIQLPDMAKPREECKGVFHHGKFHVIGGYLTESQGNFQRDAQAFDVATWQWDSDDFLEAATCSTTCVEGGDSRLYTCHNNNVTVRDGAAWQVLAGLPAELCNVAYVTAWQGKLLVIGSGRSGGPHTACVMDLKNYKWTKVAVPEEYSGHVQSGCCLEI